MRRAPSSLLSILVVLTLAAAPLWAADGYRIDPDHSTVMFKVRHLVTQVGGRFLDFSGVIRIDRENLESSAVSLTIVAASIDTDNDRRDEHLRSDEFFDVEKFPEITFESSSIRRRSGNAFDARGTFSLHGVEREITIPVELLGFTDTPQFGKRVGFAASFKLDRTEYGIEWNLPMDSGTLVLGTEVSVEIDIEAAVAPAE